MFRVVTNGAEDENHGPKRYWTLKERFLRKILGPFTENKQWKICINEKLARLYSGSRNSQAFLVNDWTLIKTNPLKSYYF